MTDHTTMPKVSRLEVIVTGARRRWTLAEKQRIVAESFAVSRNVCATARRHGLSNAQLFAWRRLAREGKLVMNGDAAGFVPAIIASEPCVPDSAIRDPSAGPQACSGEATDGRIEIVLPGARRVLIGRNADLVVLASVIEILERR